MLATLSVFIYLEMSIILPSFLKDSFTGHSIVVVVVFPFSIVSSILFYFSSSSSSSFFKNVKLQQI